jgi:sialate O-acetylesterase
MISLWRQAFETPALPFFYVELCTEYGAEEPKEEDFWMAQRASVTTLSAVGFATTTDIQRALHPPDKQDVAARLILAAERVAYGKEVVSRGPELVQASMSGGKLVATFSNDSLVVHEGIFVGTAAGCPASGNSSAFMQKSVGGKRTVVKPLSFAIDGAEVSIDCEPADGSVWVNADAASCFLYGPTGLPAPPIELLCK